MKKYWLCRTQIFIHLTLGKIYLEIEKGLIDDTGMVRSAVRPSKPLLDEFNYSEHFEEISFNNYLKLLQ